MKITKTGSLELLIAKQEKQIQKLIYVIQHDACCMEAQTKGRVAQEERNLLEKGGDSQGRHLGRAQIRGDQEDKGAYGKKQRLQGDKNNLGLVASKDARTQSEWEQGQGGERPPRIRLCDSGEELRTEGSTEVSCPGQRQSNPSLGCRGAVWEPRGMEWL